MKLISFMISLSLYDTITYNMYDMFCLVIALQAVLAVALALNLHQSA